jgi:hypothetical protein
MVAIYCPNIPIYWRCLGPYFQASTILNLSIIHLPFPRIQVVSMVTHNNAKEVLGQQRKPTGIHQMGGRNIEY